MKKKILMLIPALLLALSACDSPSFSSSSQADDKSSSNPSSQESESPAEESEESSSESASEPTSEDSKSSESSDTTSEQTTSIEPEPGPGPGPDPGPGPGPTPSEEGQYFVVGDITKVSAGKLNPVNPITYRAALGGYFVDVDDEPDNVTGTLKISASSSVSSLMNWLEWTITLEGAGQASENVTSLVKANTDVVKENVSVAVNNNPTISNSRYVQVVLSLDDDITYDDYLALNEASFSITVSYY